jgi:hypothetical protein
LFKDQDVEIWPENWQIFSLFCQLSTQWNVGMSGVVGLRYEAVYPLLDRYFSGEEWDNAFDDIRLMESEVLNIQSERN